jgi:hypothetical protein
MCSLTTPILSCRRQVCDHQAVPARFPIRYGALRPLLSLLGMGPGQSGLELDERALTVRMGWAFRATVPRASIRGAERSDGPVGGIGVHGWRGRWLVNGAASGLVAVRIDPPARALVLGVPARLTMLRVSAEDPDALVTALSA